MTTIEKLVERAVQDAKQEAIAEVTELFDKRLGELTKVIHMATAAVSSMIQDNAMRSPASRPPALDEACAADPAAGPQRIVVDVFGRQVTEYVQPGSDPAKVWADMRAAVARHARPGTGACN